MSRGSTSERFKKSGLQKKSRIGPDSQRMGDSGEEGTITLSKTVQVTRHHGGRSPALIIVKQDVGRAVRFPGDNATIYLADRRFRDQFWVKKIMS